MALGNNEIEEGKVKPIAEVVSRLRAKKTRDWCAQGIAYSGYGKPSYFSGVWFLSVGINGAWYPKVCF